MLISSMIQPYRKYHSVHENRWLLSMLDSDIGEVSSFARTQKILQARKHLETAQAGRKASSMRSPQVRYHVNFEPTMVDASARQSPTCYIIPQTPAVGVQSVIGRDQISTTPI